MNLKPRILALLVGAAFNLGAAVPPAEQLLPADTLAAVTVPDWSSVESMYAKSPLSQLWRDPEMKPFKDKFLNRFDAEVVGPLERELGIKLADYAGLARGQVTLAVTRHGWEGDPVPSPGLVLLIDTKDQSEQLKKALADLKKKWIDSGKSIKNEKIRDTDFTTLIFTGADLARTLQNAFPKGKQDSDQHPENSATNKVELIIGQSGSLLLVANNSQDLEKILARLSGGGAPALADQAEFQAHQNLCRGATAFGWLNLKPLVSILNKKLTVNATTTESDKPLAPSPAKIISAVGLNGLESLAASVNETPEGSLVHAFLSVPESERKGLFRLFAIQPRNADPPPFVPADVVKFSRWRIDGQKMWTTVETIASEISPELNGFIQMLLSNAGKDRDPNFDLKKALIGNLGDDFINFQKAPRDLTLAGLDSPPWLILVGSPNADQLVQALKTSAGVLAPTIKEREFLGRKIYALPLPGGAPADDAAAGGRSLSFAASGGYLALSTDAAMLEEYLRNGENRPKALAQKPTLQEAAQKVGGMGTGFFAYQNDRELVRITLETLKRDSGSLDKLLGLYSPSPAENEDAAKKTDWKSWLDFSLLPASEKIARYFNFTVYSSGSDSRGLNLRFFTPNPPDLKEGQ
ncbi:MAG: hypothetical protein M1608_03890 [Candidatus Omnitrophica bacterium]|nr:hypothetical protein [Candidatus Omnitrophota bacterium]